MFCSFPKNSYDFTYCSIDWCFCTGRENEILYSRRVLRRERNWSVSCGHDVSLFSSSFFWSMFPLTCCSFTRSFRDTRKHLFHFSFWIKIIFLILLAWEDFASFSHFVECCVRGREGNVQNVPEAVTQVTERQVKRDTARNQRSMKRRQAHEIYEKTRDVFGGWKNRNTKMKKRQKYTEWDSRVNTERDELLSLCCKTRYKV